MKRKSIYSIIFICFIGLLSSANQSNKCGKEAFFLAEKPVSTATSSCPEIVPGDNNAVPLNLFLFDL